MCSKKNLEEALKIALWITAIIFIALCTIGSIIVDNVHFSEIFGSQVSSIGGGIIFLSFLYPISAIIIKYALDHQNKFLFLLYWIFLIFIVALQFLLGFLAISKTAVPTEFDYNFQHACLVTANMEIPEVVTSCTPFYQSDYYAGINLAWQSYYVKSQSDLNYALDLQDLQRSGFCCGFGPPANCMEDLDTFPSFLPSGSDFLENPEKKICSKIVSSYYPPTKECSDGGYCPYDMPVGTCSAAPVRTISNGCADKMHMMLAMKLGDLATVVLVLTVFPICFILMTICLCFKRKDEDVLPPLDYAVRGGSRKKRRVFSS